MKDLLFFQLPFVSRNDLLFLIKFHITPMHNTLLFGAAAREFCRKLTKSIPCHPKNILLRQYLQHLTKAIVFEFNSLFLIRDIPSAHFFIILLLTSSGPQAFLGSRLLNKLFISRSVFEAFDITLESGK